MSDAIDLLLDYILHSEMGGKYDPEDSWVQCHEWQTDLKERALEEEFLEAIDTIHLLEKLL